MADFGIVPKGERYGVVPAFVLADPTLGQGPKVLYAALCTFAATNGLMFHSAKGLAALLQVSKRQVQRWLKELEVSGFITRLGFHGRAQRFLIIRNPAGIPWAKSLNLKAAIKETNGTVAKARRASKQHPEAIDATVLSPSCDNNVTPSATPASSIHNLTNKTPLTDSKARQDKMIGPVRPTTSAHYGLKSMREDPARERIQAALVELAAKVGGWPALFQRADTEIASLLAQNSDGEFAAHEVLACLRVSQ